MSDIQVMIYEGRLGRDMELRPSKEAGGEQWVGNAIASTRVYYTGEGDTREKHEQTTWINFYLRGAKAEAAAKYLEKGQKVTLVGNLSPAPDGNPGGYEKDGSFVPQYEMYVSDISYGEKATGRGGEPGEVSRPATTGRRREAVASTRSAPKPAARSVQRPRPAAAAPAPAGNDDDDDPWNLGSEE